MANGYLTYDPYDFKKLTSGIAAPPQWMFNTPYTSFEDAMNEVSRTRNNEATADFNANRAEQSQRGLDAQDAMMEIANQEADLTTPEASQKIIRAGLSKGSLDEAYRFAQTLKQMEDLNKPEKPKAKEFRPNAYGGYMLYDPATGQVDKQGPFAIPRAAGGANGQRAQIGFLNYDTGERLSQDEYNNLSPEEQDGFFPEKMAMSKVDVLREAKSRKKEESSKSVGSEGPGYLEQFSDYLTSLVKPSPKVAPSVDGPPGPPPPGMKWRKKGSK